MINKASDWLIVSGTVCRSFFQYIYHYRIDTEAGQTPGDEIQSNIIPFFGETVKEVLVHFLVICEAVVYVVYLIRL